MEGVFGLVCWICVGLLLGKCFGADPFANFELDVSYITASPLGVPQQVNSLFPIWFFHFSMLCFFFSFFFFLLINR